MTTSVVPFSGSREGLQWRRLRLISQSLLLFLRRDVLTALAGLAGGLVIWEIVSLVSTQTWLPAPVDVLRRTGHLLFQDSSFRSAFFSSLGETAVGFGFAVVLGAILGVAMSASRFADSGLRHYLDLLLIIPPAAIAPILVVMFGLTTINIIIIAAMLSLSVVAITTASAVKGVDPSLLEVGAVFGITSHSRLVRLVIAPAMMPQFFLGLHLGVTRAMKGMIVGQVVVGVIGVGAYEATYAQSFDATGLWAIALILVVTSLILAWCVRAVDSIVNYWAYRD